MAEDTFMPPKAPKDLCFGELDFVQKNFDVDEFLHNHRKNVSLEKMRDDLGLYLKTLRSAMIELINKDYADFVNLSSNLIGLDTAIANLETPLGQLREEVLQIRQVLEDTINELRAALEKRHQIREQKRSLHSLMRIHKSVVKLSLILPSDCIDNHQCIEPDILERAATEFNQLKFHISRCKTEMSQDQHKKIVDLDEILKTNLSKLLVKNIQDKDSTGLTRCLRIYVTLDKVLDAEEIVKLKIVRCEIKKFVNEETLQSEPLELQGIYNKIENVLDEELKELLHLSVYHESTSLEGFNFLVNSFWPEVEDQLENNLSLIFAPGNPDLFHRRYTETLRFLSNLENRCSKPEIVSVLKNHSQYKRFLKKWNLPVYFQIRFQEIAGCAESVLYESATYSSMAKDRQSVDNNEFSLYSTRMIWDCLIRTWSDEVFLPQLLHKFWKLSLQLLSRYNEWSLTSLSTSWQVKMENETEMEIESSHLEFLVCLYTDNEKLISRLPGFLEIVINKIPFSNKKITDSLSDCLKVTRKNMEETCLPKITEEIVNELLNQSSQHLKQISDIPRLFRRTNREIPTKPCTYVKNALNGIVNFHAKYKKVIPMILERWLILTLCSLTKRYLSLVTDVLTSVQKTEESLKRLKKIRDKSTGATSSEGTGVNDDEKIRIQLAIDVVSYARIVNDLGIEESNITHLHELKQLVESVVKTKIEPK